MRGWFDTTLIVNGPATHRRPPTIEDVQEPSLRSQDVSFCIA